MIHSSTDSSTNTSASVMSPRHHRKTGVAALAIKRGKRGVAGQRRDREPDCAKGDGRRPGEAEQKADIGRHALAAAKAEPNRKQMAEERADRGDQREIAAEDVAR